jgi:hypothetical protein
MAYVHWITIFCGSKVKEWFAKFKVLGCFIFWNQIIFYKSLENTLGFLPVFQKFIRSASFIFYDSRHGNLVIYELKKHRFFYHFLLHFLGLIFGKKF